MSDNHVDKVQGDSKIIQGAGVSPGPNVDFYMDHGYTGNRLPHGSPLHTGIWANGNGKSHEYIDSDGESFRVNPENTQQYWRPVNKKEEEAIKRALEPTRQDYKGWTERRKPSETPSHLSYHDQYILPQTELLSIWACSVESAPKLFWTDIKDLDPESTTLPQQ